MVLTEKKALQQSFDLWIWLYQNPGKEKEDSPYWEEIKNSKNNCLLCEKYSYCAVCPGYGESCFNNAYYYWFDRTFVDGKDYVDDLYGAKIAAAYIASKIRRKLRSITDDV